MNAKVVGRGESRNEEILSVPDDSPTSSFSSPRLFFDFGFVES